MVAKLQTDSLDNEVNALSLPESCTLSFTYSPHLPGSGSAPDPKLLIILASLAQQGNAASWQTNLIYRAGWTLFSEKHYWEAHEAWEQVWMQLKPNSIERTLLEFLIQVANRRLKILLGKESAGDKIQRVIKRLATRLADSHAFAENAMVWGVSEKLVRQLQT